MHFVFTGLLRDLCNGSMLHGITTAILMQETPLLRLTYSPSTFFNCLQILFWKTSPIVLIHLTTHSGLHTYCQRMYNSFEKQTVCLETTGYEKDEYFRVAGMVSFSNNFLQQ